MRVNTGLLPEPYVFFSGQGPPKERGQGATKLIRSTPWQRFAAQMPGQCFPAMQTHLQLAHPKGKNSNHFNISHQTAIKCTNLNSH